MAKRLVGEAVVRMTYDDMHNQYRCNIAVEGRHVYRCSIPLPRSTGHFNDLGLGIGVAVDAPEAYDKVAVMAAMRAVDDGALELPDGAFPVRRLRAP